MTTLDAAAGIALERLKELLPRLEGAERTFEEGAGRVGEACREVDSRWRSVREAFQAFGLARSERSADAHGQRMLRSERLALLRARLDEARELAEEKTREVKDELDEAGAEVEATEGELAELLERTESAAEAFAARAGELDERFEQAMDRAVRFMEDEVRPGLERMREQAEQGAEDLRALIEERCVPRVEEKAAEAMGALDVVAEQVEQAMGEAEERIREGSRQAVQACAEAYEEVTAAALELGGRVEDALEALLETLGSGAAELTETGGEAEQAQGRMREDLHEVIGGVGDVLASFSRFTFI